jgi:ectoine hydroxylase-related dioxygenase (phytanoyl-CoA dioxygenase family)
MSSLDEALNFLEDNGYAVLSDVLSETEVSEGISLMWDFIEGLDQSIKRNEPSTYSSPNFPDPFGYGTVVGDGAGQSEFMWYCRGKQNIQTIYRRIWNTDNLITSFDGFCLHRPWEYNMKWRTNDKLGYHLDQNGKTKSGKVCVQGFLNFFDAGVEDGGLVLVPGSHKVFKVIFDSRPSLGADSMDFVRMTDDPMIW